MFPTPETTSLFSIIQGRRKKEKGLFPLMVLFALSEGHIVLNFARDLQIQL